MSNKERAILNIGAKIPKGWKILVQETKALPSWVYCLKDAQDRLFYCKVGTCFDGTKLQVLFEPLSSDECLKLGLNVEETYSEKTKHYVEESNNSEPWNPEEEDFETYRKKLELTNRTSGKLNVKSVENMRKKLEELEEEKEDYRSKLQLIADQAFEKRKMELNAPEDVDTPEKLRGFELAKTEKSTPSGTVSLASQNARENEGFDSYEEMIEHLISIESKKGLPSREAKKILNEFWKRSQKAIGDAKRPIEVVVPSNEQLASGKGLKQIINERYRKRHEIEEE